MTVMTLSHATLNPHQCEIFVLEINLHATFLCALGKKINSVVYYQSEDH